MAAASANAARPVPGRVGRVLALLGEGNRHIPGAPFRQILIVAAVGASGYVLYLAGFGTANSQLQIAAFLTVLLPFTFLTTTASKRRSRLSVPDVVLALASFATALFYVFRNEAYQNWMVGISELERSDLAAGIALVILLFEACRRSAGWGLTGVMLALLAYTFLGQYIGGAFHHDGIGLDYFITMQAIGTVGIFGTPLEVAASYAFLFVLFGSFYHYAGGGRLFFDLAAALTGRFVGGPAKACVVSSGLYGSISGSPTADVATTGPINIPIMLRVGIPPARAGAIEAAASCGGAMLPPVMGAVAFLMADYTGMPYLSVVKAAVISAVLYYVGVFLLVDFEARRLGQGQVPEDEMVRLGPALRRSWHHFIPITVLVYLLAKGYSPAYVAAVSTFAVVVSSWIDPANRIGLKGLYEACFETVHRLVPLVAAVAAAGIIIGCIELTGLAGKFSLLIFSLSQGNMVVSLVMAMVILILLGMGMPTPGVYIMGIALIAPVLTGEFGLPLLGVHMFILFFSCMSAITPPVAVACFTAAPIAGANPMSIGPYACKLAVGGFVLPFYFLFNPGILMEGTAAQILTDTVLGLFVVVAAAAALHGFVGVRRLHLWNRALLAAGAVALMYPAPQAKIAGALAVTLILGLPWIGSRVRRTAP